MASVKKLKDVMKALQKASKLHGNQAKIIKQHLLKFHKNKK